MLAIGRLELVDLETRAAELRLGLIDGNLVWLRIDLEQELPLPDALIVLDGDFDHLTGNPGVDRLLCRADEGIVRRDVRLLGEIVRRAASNQQDRNEDQQRATQSLAQRLLWNRGGAVRYDAVQRSLRLGVNLDRLRRLRFLDCNVGRYRSYRGVGQCGIGLHDEPHGREFSQHWESGLAPLPQR